LAGYLLNLLNNRFSGVREKKLTAELQQQVAGSERSVILDKE